MKTKQANNLNGKKPVNKIIFGLIILAVLLASLNLWTIYYYLPQRLNQREAGEKDRYNLLNPARKLINQEDLIINFQSLRDYLKETYEADPNISIYFEFLNTGANISISKDAEFWPASLLKVPVAMAAAKKIENGIWKRKNELVIMPSDKNERFGELYKQPIGTRLEIEELIRLVLTESDNTANFILVRNLEPSEFQNIYEHLGLTEFISNEGKISAKKYSVMFRALYNASYLSEENSQKLLSLMTETKFKEYLGSGLPQDIKFSHKIGISDDKEVFLDSGIIYLANRPYLLTAMINTKDIAFAQKEMKEISEKVYNYIANYSD
ncbi:MAG: serine hydrolase [Patescibacteria group bacterium]